MSSLLNRLASADASPSVMLSLITHTLRPVHDTRRQKRDAGQRRGEGYGKVFKPDLFRFNPALAAESKNMAEEIPAGCECDLPRIGLRFQPALRRSQGMCIRGNLIAVDSHLAAQRLPDQCCIPRY